MLSADLMQYDYPGGPLPYAEPPAFCPHHPDRPAHPKGQGLCQECEIAAWAEELAERHADRLAGRREFPGFTVEDAERELEAVKEEM